VFLGFIVDNKIAVCNQLILHLHKTFFMQIILVLHSLLRWAVVLLGVWAIFNALTGILSKRNYTAADNRTGLLLMISCDVQLLIGLILYFSNGWFDQLKNFGQIKSDAYQRFFAMEHALMMLIAWVLVHAARSAVKRTDDDKAKHRKSLIFFGLAFVIIFAAVPWPFRENLHRTWLSWF
jgi:hypothetical protein